MAAAVSVVAPPPSALAKYSATAVPGGSRAFSQAVPAPAAPIAVATGRDVALSWSATLVGGQVPATAYVVRRYDAGDVAQTVLANCVVVSTNSCTERNVPNGTWTFSVRAQLGSWTGPESAKSASITVLPPAFTVTSPSPIISLPSVVTGSISGFTVGTTVSYRLDSTTGPALSGSPTTVTSSESMSVSVTLPTGTTDAPHSIFVGASDTLFAAASINLSFPPLLQSMQMRDTDADGTVDQVTVTFNDTLAAYSAGTAPWTLTNVPSGGSLASVSVAGATATLTLTEGMGAATTAVGSFTVALAANPAGIRDVYDHPASFAATAPADAAAPVVQNLLMTDQDADGRIDRLTMSFTEALAAYSAPTSVWTLTGVPSGGTRGTVTVTSPDVTINVTEGAGAVDTAVGSFTVSLASSSTGIRDAAGNRSSFTASPADGAEPILVTTEMFDDDANGKVDRVLDTFSEVLAPFAAPTSVFTLTSAPSGATLQSVTTSGTGATLALSEGVGAATTAVGSFTTALASHGSGIRDAAGNLSSYTARAPTDRAAPALLTLTLLDNDTDGKVDRLTAVFSESLATYSAGTTPWLLRNVPSNGSLASVARSGSTLTLTLTEGGGAADTAVGSMTVAMASHASGARDAAGNRAAFDATTPLDGAKPVPMSISDTNGATNGRAETGDSISITFSEPLAPATVPASSTVTLTGGYSTADTLSMSGISNGAGSTGGTSYITTTGAAASSMSVVTLSNANKTLTVTIGANCSGTGCAALGTQTTNGTYSYVAATTLTDVAGNSPRTTARTSSMRLF
ncbi:MAG: hypothetical protein AB7U39_15895 [Ilumatobacteraceae bacterium]